jgi:hypothetical protein
MVGPKGYSFTFGDVNHHMLCVADKLSDQEQRFRLDSFWVVVLFSELTAPQLAAVCRLFGLQNDHELLKDGKRAVGAFLDLIFRRSTATAAPISPAMALLLSNPPTPYFMNENKESYDAAAVRAYLQPVLGMKLSALLPSVVSVKQAILNAQQQGNVASMRVHVEECCKNKYTVWFGEDGARRALGELSQEQLGIMMRALPPSVAAFLHGQRGSGVRGKVLMCDRIAAVRNFLAGQFSALHSVSAKGRLTLYWTVV